MKDYYQILLVEDNIGDVILAQEAFENIGITDQLIVASNGHEALDILNDLSENGSLPHLILMDLNMPIINGLELLDTIRKNDQFKHIPTLLLTTSEAQKDIISAYELGANAFLVKPFNIDEFNEMVKRIVNFWILPVEKLKVSN